MMSLNKAFDIERCIDDLPKKNNESEFSYYNRSTMSVAIGARKLIEDALAHYPASEVDELVSRIRSGNNELFRSATFELFLYDLLRKNGFVLEPHPDLDNGSSKKPDFLATAPDGGQFLLEAVLAHEHNNHDKGSESRRGEVMDYISNYPHKNFLIQIKDKGTSKTSPSGKKLKNLIHRWLDELDPDEISEIMDEKGIGAIEPFKWSHEEWEVEVLPIPIAPHKRGKSNALIGIGGMPASFVNSRVPVRDNIISKGGRYGDIDIPLVIAVNVIGHFHAREDDIQALFGEEVRVFSRKNINASPKFERAPNGAWNGINGVQCTRVSAAWIFSEWCINSELESKGTLYLNPWAKKSVSEAVKIFPHAYVENNNIVWNE